MGFIKPGWPVLIAGTVHKADEVIGWFETNLDVSKVTELNVFSEIRKLSRQFFEHLRDETSQLQYGATVPELIAQKAFPRQEIEQISSFVSTGAELIISTIINDQPFIFEVRPDGSVVSHDNYAIIGVVAQASAFMQWRCVINNDPLSLALYEVYETKRFSEMDKDIGHYTSMYVLAPDGKTYRVKNSYLEKLDRMRRADDKKRGLLKLPIEKDWRCVQPEDDYF
jgi:hypothetical protein